MIENKYKARSIETGEWVEGYFAIKGKGSDLEKHFICVSTLNTQSSIPYFYLTDIEVNPETVCRFIGLQDVNKNDIFEDDNILYYDETQAKWCKTQVVWWNEFICFTLKNTEYDLNFMTCNQVEVKGNIHD